MSSDSSSTSSVSIRYLKAILENLKFIQNRESTRKNYFSVWRKFNRFVIHLDIRPLLWEERASLFGAFLVDEGIQSSTLKSYMSAIKRILIDDGYPWNDDKLMLSILTRGCRVVNDRVKTRLPIQSGLLDMLLFELHRLLGSQYYLETLYKTIFVTAYYRLFRIGELMESPHRSSKTHGKDRKPQHVKISASAKYTPTSQLRHFCPFQLSREYLELRGNYMQDDDFYFMFRDRQPVKSTHVQKMLRKALAALGLNPLLYNTHSFCSGWAVDLLKFADLNTVKMAG